MKAIIAALFNFKQQGFVLFGPARRTVNGALVHFNKALDELKAVEDQENAEVDRQGQLAAEATSALNAASKEAARARKAQSRILSLIGDDIDAIGEEAEKLAGEVEGVAVGVTQDIVKEATAVFAPPR